MSRQVDADISRLPSVLLFRVIFYGRGPGRVGCCAFGGSATSSFGFDGASSSVTFDVEFENCAVMNEPVNGGQGHRGVGEDLVPFAERLVGGNEDGTHFISSADEFEQDTGFGLIFTDVGEVVENQQMVFVELVDGGLQGQVAARDL